MRALVPLFAAVLALALAGQAPYRPEMTGSDYGDLLDSIRTRLELASHEKEPENAGNIGHIRNMLIEIKRGLIREQQAADRLFGGVGGEYKQRRHALKREVNDTLDWMRNARNATKLNAERIVNLTIAINENPQAQANQQIRVDEWNDRVNTLRRERRKARKRFLARSSHTKDTLSGLHEAVKTIGAKQGDFTYYNTTLKAALNRHNNPKLRALLNELGSANVFASQDDLDDLRLLFARLHRQLHHFLASITRTYVAYNDRTRLRLRRLMAKRDAAVKRMADLVAAVPNAQAEIKQLIQDTSRMHHTYPYKVSSVHKARKALRRLRRSHVPLVQQYELDNTRRASQLQAVRELLHIVAERYDARPGVHKPHVAK